MAERRMIAKTIIDSDAFLEMPATTQLLYFHLCLRADDEGFVNKPKSIMRLIGCKEDDLKVLIAKKFVIPFDSGVVVIKHWKIHNYIRGDRLHETKYTDEKAQLFVEDNQAYTLWQSSGGQLSVTCPTEVRLGKDSIGKDRLVEDREVKASKEKDIKHYHGTYNNVRLTDKEYAKLADDYGIDVRDKAISFFDEYIEEKGYKSKSHNLAIRRWVVNAVSKNQQKGGSKKAIDWDNL